LIFFRRLLRRLFVGIFLVGVFAWAYIFKAVFGLGIGVCMGAGLDGGLGVGFKARQLGIVLRRGAWKRF